jgi:hypothetical protein
MTDKKNSLTLRQAKQPEALLRAMEWASDIARALMQMPLYSQRIIPCPTDSIYPKMAHTPLA